MFDLTIYSAHFYLWLYELDYKSVHKTQSTTYRKEYVLFNNILNTFLVMVL